MRENRDDLLTVTMPRWIWGIVRVALIAYGKKRMKDHLKAPDFVPEPGRTNVNLLGIEGSKQALAAIEAVAR